MITRMDLPPIARRVDVELRRLADGPIDSDTMHELRGVLVNAITALENDLFIERGRLARL